MKKLLSLCVVFLFVLNVSAQLKVYSNGHTGICKDATTSYALFNVGYSDIDVPSYSLCTISAALLNSNKFYIGIDGLARSWNPINTGRAIGVRGTAGNSTSGYNYGVIGFMYGNQNGAAVYGTLGNPIGNYVPGRYAGYFEGDTYVNGTFTATDVVTPSDIRLKENVVSLSEESRATSTLDNVLDMNVIAYNYKANMVAQEERSDTAQTAAMESRKMMAQKISAARHYGLSAQELQTLYPDLVREGQDGYLGINYVELVPILIRSIQELNQKIEDLQGLPQVELKKAVAASSGMSKERFAGAALYQNTPNPFTAQTDIRFRLPDDAVNAYIYIFDMQGKMLKQIPVSSAQDKVTVDGYELTAGIYLYSLVINGQEIDTKRMILSK